MKTITHSSAAHCKGTPLTEKPTLPIAKLFGKTKPESNIIYLGDKFKGGALRKNALS